MPLSLQLISTTLFCWKWGSFVIRTFSIRSAVLFKIFSLHTATSILIFFFTVFPSKQCKDCFECRAMCALSWEQIYRFFPHPLQAPSFKPSFLVLSSVMIFHTPSQFVDLFHRERNEKMRKMHLFSMHHTAMYYSELLASNWGPMVLCHSTFAKNSFDGADSQENSSECH